MRRIAKSVVMAAAAAALLLALLPFPPATALEDTGAVKYNVRIVEGSNLISVELVFRSGKDSFDLYPVLEAGRQSPIILPEGYFRDIKATDSLGGQLTVTDEGPRWTISGAPEGTITYSIDIGTLSGLSSDQTGTNNPAYSPYLPHRGNSYVFMPGYCLFLVPAFATDEYGAIIDPDTCGVSFDLPEGWEAYYPWEEESVTPGLAVASGIFAGKATVVETDGDIPLAVIQASDADKANLSGQQEFADKLADQLQTASVNWGRDPSAGSRLLVYLGLVDIDKIGENAVSSISLDPFNDSLFIPVGKQENVLSEVFLERAGEEGLRSLMVPFFTPETLWFREGCIRYSNLRFAQQNMWISEEDVYDQLGSDYALYVDTLASSKTSLAGAGDEALFEPNASLLFSGGAIAGASLDTMMAGYESNLDALLKSLMSMNSMNAGGPVYIVESAEGKRATRSPEQPTMMEGTITELTNQFLMERVECLCGASFDSFFNDYITGTETIPASSFSQLKLDRDCSSEKTAEIPDTPAPGFGNRWILIVVAIGAVFALPFILEPYTLKPRAGAVPLDEEEEDAERRKARRGRWWSWDEDEDDGEDDGEDDEPEAPTDPEGHE